MNQITEGETRSHLAEAFRGVRFVIAALAAGSHVVPLADNRPVVAELAARAADIYGRRSRHCR